VLIQCQLGEYPTLARGTCPSGQSTINQSLVRRGYIHEVTFFFFGCCYAATQQLEALSNQQEAKTFISQVQMTSQDRINTQNAIETLVFFCWGDLDHIYTGEKSAAATRHELAWI